MIVPAHDEAGVIGRSLRRMLEGAPEGLEVIVAANGCSDDTAEVCRATAPEVTVLELETSSKIAALNAADAAASRFPRAYVDADVEVSGEALAALAALLDRPGGPLVASPRMVLDLEGASVFVKMYYRIWERTAFRTQGHVGSGLYALSREGRARFGVFPSVVADDRYVQQLFSLDERATLHDHHFVVRPPRTLHALIARGGRIAAGNQELARLGLATRPEGQNDTAEQSGVRSVLPQLPTRPTLWLPFVVYCVTQLATRIVAERKLRRGQLHHWDRDETSRA
ncbi:glycosyltransferase [Salinibacterium sp. SYSU T00001]|uniref:glycosyltransferase n=1 Tax=Homoserinimonas sedimenticola TaxID=2986805 RepID=UPI0022363E2A|nr:glycosyltransferase [Salinibacterium sedimenticola]MCW4384765.1 glycosyltransferase [Salinibacterium sedimenticola]